ncbi:hypothetical protein DdX_20474 [Ditylenchus destructor]|uniref:Uncharacterized protein n=1 Tax=Ditylenchus destructor TaxID=166010 RepID=A0AAD4QWI0_9BILA|nr:hypothetical protein DdX_20474 [Ditylenchus destructor]
MSQSTSTSQSCSGVNRGWVETEPCNCACGCDDKSICRCEQHVAKRIAWVELEMVPLIQKEILGTALTFAKIPPRILYIGRLECYVLCTTNLDVPGSADLVQALPFGQYLLAPLVPTSEMIRRYGRICAVRFMT